MTIQNLPCGDHRAAEFTEKLLQFIRTEAYGLPFPTVLGVIELAKDELKDCQSSEIV